MEREDILERTTDTKEQIDDIATNYMWMYGGPGQYWGSSEEDAERAALLNELET